MIRIVGVQHHQSADREFILLQNQCSMRIHLKGHAVISELALMNREWAWGSHFFTDDTHIPAGMYVMLHSGNGEPYWGRSKDGSLVYHAYMERREPVWSESGPLHILRTQHSYAERKDAFVPA